MLGITGRRILLSVHILLNAILVGGFAAIVYLNSIKQGIENGDQLYAINLTIFKIHDNIISSVAFAVLLTGLLFSLLTKWGFFDFYWIIIKWVSLVLLFYLVIAYLGPAINGMVAISDVHRVQALSNPLYQDCERNTTLLGLWLLTILIAVITLSVFKPWGKRGKRFVVNRKVVLSIGFVAGLTVMAVVFLQFMQLQQYRNIEVQNINLSTVSDGTYVGKAYFGVQYKVEVVITANQVTRITVIENRTSFYAKLAESVAIKVTAAQKLNVDAVTGATTTSKCLLRAIEDALEKGTSVR